MGKERAMAHDTIEEERPAPQFIVEVDDNFHYQDECERYTLGAFPDCESAVAACQRLVDENLRDYYKPTCTAEGLFTYYTMFGDDPFIVSPDGNDCEFSAWDYARKRSEELCGKSESRSRRAD
jgi:hypothetical protein